jgi:hypothetical protein
LSISTKDKIEFIRQTFGFSREDTATQLHTIWPEVNSMARGTPPSERVSLRLDWLYSVSLFVDKLKIAKLGSLVKFPLDNNQSLFDFLYSGSGDWYWAAYRLKVISIEQVTKRFERKGYMHRTMLEAMDD